MSQANEESNRISVNEQGEVIINDPEIAAAIQDLSDEELDAIAGGRAADTNSGSGTNGCKCGKT